MNNRLLDIIKYKTGGRQKTFAEFVGWTPQYLAKLLRGDNFGLQPVLTLMEKLPEINARWFLLGEGTMMNDSTILSLQQKALSRAGAILKAERFLPVMSPDEIKRFEDAVLGNSDPDYSDAEVERWEALLAARKWTLEDKVNDAMLRSKL